MVLGDEVIDMLHLPVVEAQHDVDGGAAFYQYFHAGDLGVQEFLFREVAGGEFVVVADQQFDALFVYYEDGFVFHTLLFIEWDNKNGVEVFLQRGA